MEAKRQEVATLMPAGHKTSHIINLLIVSKVTACRVKKRLVKTARIGLGVGDPLSYLPRLPKRHFCLIQGCPWVNLPRRRRVSARRQCNDNAIRAAGGKSLKLIARPLLT